MSSRVRIPSPQVKLSRIDRVSSPASPTVVHKPRRPLLTRLDAYLHLSKHTHKQWLAQTCHPASLRPQQVRIPVATEAVPEVTPAAVAAAVVTGKCFPTLLSFFVTLSVSPSGLCASSFLHAAPPTRPFTSFHPPRRRDPSSSVARFFAHCAPHPILREPSGLFRAAFALCAHVVSNDIRLSPRLRREGRSNGTAILRRSSTTPFNNQASPLPAIDNLLNSSANEPHPSSVSQFAPAQDTANGKYSRDDLLDFGKMADPGNVDLRALFMSSFSPGGNINGQNTRGWGKPNDAHSHNDPSVCWDQDGELGPLGHQDMSAEEKEVGTICDPRFLLRFVRLCKAN